MLAASITDTYGMDPRRLLLFRTIARAGSMTAGARELGWTQPAVSQHMSRLEREIGTPVFVRSTQGVALTEAGEALLRRADEVAALMHAASEEMHDYSLARRGTVRLVAFPSALATLVPAALVSLEASHPGIEVALSEAEPPEALEALAAGEADLALTFRYDHEPQPSGVRSVSLAREEVRLIVPADAAAPNSLAQLHDAVWAAGCERCSAHLFTVAAAAGFTPRVRHTSDDYVVVQALVAQGLAVAALTELSLRAHAHPGVRAVRLKGLGSRIIEAATQPGVERVPAVGVVLQALRSAA